MKFCFANLCPKNVAMAIFALAVFLVSSNSAEEPTWLAGMDSFKWINDAGSNMKSLATHETFFSKANQTRVGYYLRFPRGYDAPENKDRRYPVIYFLHGGRPGSEAKSIKEFQNMNAFLTSVKYPSVFVFGVNGGKLSHYEYGDYKGESAFLELVAHMDASYRTIANREGSVVMGSSQGGRGTRRCAFKFPLLLGTAITLYGGFQFERTINENQGVESEYLTIEDQGRNNVFNNASLYAANKAAPKLNLMVVIGDQDDNYVGNQQWSVHLRKLGIPHQLVVDPGAGHNVNWNIENTVDRIYRFITASLNP